MMIKKFLATGGLTAVLVGGIAGVAVATTYHPASAAVTAAAVQHVRATGPAQANQQEPNGEATAPEPSGEATAPEPSGEATAPETDGPGGHQDVTGQNVDHQFNGVE
jgi:hypothetical protein